MDEIDWNTRYSDDDFIYGTEPNPFLVRNASKLIGPVLSLAEGEGRNAVFLAALGFQVHGVDGSAVGLAKGRRLAFEKGVDFQTEVADLATYEPAINRYRSVISISAHLSSIIASLGIDSIGWLKDASCPMEYFCWKRTRKTNCVTTRADQRCRYADDRVQN